MVKQTGVPIAPDQGDVVWLEFDPQAGHEQAGTRPALVLSKRIFNERTGFAVVLPVTTQAKGYPFEVHLTGTAKLTGVALADQLRSLDYKARSWAFADHVDEQTLRSAQRLIQAILAL